MRLFLTILEGPSPAEAKPLVATEDSRVIAAAVRELASRLAPGRPKPRVPDRRRGKPAEPETGQ
ncbi:MAG: hypothetical protein L0214_00230 [candidate division NC10 bacterium]|nr:hypothetical protein [candidate division NC10 bacterium]